MGRHPILWLVRTFARKAWRAAADPRRTLREAVVLGDLVRFRRRSSAALKGVRPRRSGRGVALFISMSDLVYQLKLEGILAKALELEGYRPVFLTIRNARWAERYFRSFGFEEFVYPDEFLSAERAAEAEAAADGFLRGEVTAQALKTFEFRGAQVGKQTLSSLARRFLQGRVSLDDPAVREALDDVLRESLRSVLRGEELVERLRPELAFFNEKGYAGLGSIYDVALARGTNVIQFLSVGMHARDALVFKRYTPETRLMHPASLSEESWRLVRDMPWTDVEERELEAEFEQRYGEGEKHPDAGLQQGKLVKSPDEVRAQLDLDPTKKTVVLFSHLLWDASFFFGEDLFEDQETWLVETVRAACANPRVNWVVKLHPANMYKGGDGELNDEVAIREAVGELPTHVRLVRPETDLNTYSLFSVCDAGITIRGTIGLELPCFGIPVLTAGTGRYSGLGFTNDSASAAEYLEKLARADELSRLSDEEIELAKRHAWALFRARPFRFTSYRSSFMDASAFRAGHPLASNLELTARSSRELEEARDLRELAAWARDASQLDYLALAPAQAPAAASRPGTRSADTLSAHNRH